MDPELKQLLAGFDAKNAGSVRKLAARIAIHPPTEPNDVALAFRPLFQSRDYNIDDVFPALFAGLEHSSVAAAILDLANHLTRTGRVLQHPAADRAAQLISLLGGLVDRLGRLEEKPFESGQSAAELSAQVAESVSLAVALCDALALIGDKEAVGKLYRALELEHRRLRTEAAAALARLGEEAGLAALLALAAEPVARLRVLAYAEELGVLEKVNLEFASPVARAEAELVVWLAEPTQFGLPPKTCELVDSRTQFWPGFDEPVECFLFRYSYELGETRFSNVGIAGPMSRAFIADLADLPPDDIYAAYAGWQAEHEEIRETEVTSLTVSQRTDVARLERRLRDAGYESLAPLTLSSFFGDKVLVAQARWEGVEGIAVADAEETFWRPIGRSRRPLGPHEAYCIYKGRRLLRTFNE